MVNWLSRSIFPCLLIRLFIGPAMVTSFLSPPPSSPPLSPTLNAIVIHASLFLGGCVCVQGEGDLNKIDKKTFPREMVWYGKKIGPIILWNIFGPPPHP